MHVLKGIVSGVFFLCLCTLSSEIKAQEIKWPNPEAEALYKSAQASLAAGAYNQAIASYQQLITLVPTERILHRDLANAFFRAGQLDRAEKTITPLLDDARADAQTFALASSIQSKLKEDRKARKILDAGIEKFPRSGFLYHEYGKLYEEKKDEENALKQWLAGMRAEPNYHLNYYDAARSYFLTNKPVWAILYGEIFLNMERSTPRSNEMRKMLLAAYKKFYATPDVLETKSFGEKTSRVAGNFEDAVTQIFYKLAPVVSDGINTENLTILRTRFALEWQAIYAARYPYALFTLIDELLRAGHFDAYNQWLFGRVENVAAFEAWNKFHPEAIPEYEAYYRQHPLKMTTVDARQSEVSSRIFIKQDNKNKR